MPVLLVEATAEVSASTNSVNANVVRELLETQRIAFDHLKVSNISAIAPTSWIALDSAEYEGLIVIGGIVGKDERSLTLFRECARNVHDAAMQHSMPLGFGVVVTSSTSELESSMLNASKEAALSCVEVLRILHHYQVMEHESDISTYQN